MSDTVTRPWGAAVHRYVFDVRAALADLPSEDIEDLTGGLEADLAERAAELPADGDLASAFGPADVYAAELRAAADLPPRSLAAASATPRINPVRVAEIALRERRDALLARHIWLADLRPVWWVARGAVLGGWVALLVASGAPRRLALGFIVVGAALSFAVSRGSERRASSWLNRLVVVANLVTLVVALPVAATWATPEVRYETYVQPTVDLPRDGAFVNGEMASNLYAYDAQGNRIDRVRLFNQYGQAVSVPSAALLQQEMRDPANALPRDAKGDFSFSRSVFPVRWGSRTGWEPSDGQWEPPIKISPLGEAAVGTASAPRSTGATGSAGSVGSVGSAGSAGSAGASASPEAATTP